jgi:uncharacterized protein with von Willebrand factor type A (vWA) domain
MSEKIADYLYRQAMDHEQRPGSSTSARAAFQQAAAMGHTRALSALAHYMFTGRGGTMEQDRALFLLWSCFEKGDHQAIEELVDMLHSYAEQVLRPADAEEARVTADKLNQLRPLFEHVSEFMHKTMRAWYARVSNADVGGLVSQNVG